MWIWKGESWDGLKKFIILVKAALTLRDYPSEKKRFELGKNGSKQRNYSSSETLRVSYSYIRRNEWIRLMVGLTLPAIPSQMHPES